MAADDAAEMVSQVGPTLLKSLSMQLDAAAAEPTGQKRAMRAFSTAFSGTMFDEKMAEKLSQTLVVSFLYFKEPLDLSQTRKVMKERLCQIPRFRSRPVSEEEIKPGLVPRLAFQQLSDDTLDTVMPELVRDLTGKVRNCEDVDQFVSEVYQAKPDPRLPLWRGYLCNNMDDGRSMFMLVIDHAIADGVALVQTLMSVLDEQPDLPVPTRSVKPPPVSCFAQLRGLVQACWGPFIGDQLPADPPNRLKTKDARNPGRSKAVYSTPDIDMARIREVTGAIPGATINDVLMTVVAMTLQEYFSKYEATSLKQKVRANFPINMRSVTGGDIIADEHFGNRFSQGQIRFPLHLAEPQAIFNDIKAQIDMIKVSPEPHVREKLINFLVLNSGLSSETICNALLDAFGKVTAMLSNVPGPLKKVNFMSRELEDLSFYAMGPIGLYFGILQYRGQFKAGICCDASLEPDPKKLADCWLPAFERLHEAVTKK